MFFYIDARLSKVSNEGIVTITFNQSDLITEGTLNSSNTKVYVQPASEVAFSDDFDPSDYELTWEVSEMTRFKLKL